MTLRLLALLLACASTPEGDVDAPGARTLAAGARQVTFGSLSQVGAFVYHTTVVRENPDLPGSRQVEDTEVRWADSDHWAATRARDGRLVRSALVLDGVGWLGTTAPTDRVEDAEVLRVQLARTWDPWDALSTVRDQLTLEDTRSDRPLASRTLWRHRPVLRAEERAVGPKGRPKREGRRGWTVTAVDGEVWLEEVGATWLSGWVRVEAARVGSARGGGVAEGVSPSAPGERTVIEVRVETSGVGTRPALPRAPG